MAFEELTMLAAGYWLSESRTKDGSRRLDWESAAGLAQDALDLVWQLLLLAGLGWVLHALSVRLPQADLTVLELTIASAYALSLLRHRPKGAAEPYFLALTVLTLTAQQVPIFSGLQGVGMLLRILGGSLACEVVLLGLKDRLRWSTAPKAVHETPMAFLCLALLALLVRCLGL